MAQTSVCVLWVWWSEAKIRPKPDRLKSLCENCEIGTSAAKAGLILEVLCRGQSHDPQRFLSSHTDSEACPTRAGRRRSNAGGIFSKARIGLDKSQWHVRRCGGETMLATFAFD